MQIVGYRTGVDSEAAPALFVSEDGAVSREALTPGKQLQYRLGKRHCAGIVDDGVHEPCANQQAPYCDQHTSKWPCARCTGSCSLPLDTCREEHAIYLAAFAPANFKVGVTRSWRLETRLREQGADRAAHLRTVDNGRIARQIEADIAEQVGDSVRVSTKIDGLHRRVDTAAWTELLGGFDPISAYEFESGFTLTERPVAETLAAGDVLGTKGRVLLLERGGSTYAVDMRDLVGHEVRAGDTDRALQSNLGSFG